MASRKRKAVCNYAPQGAGKLVERWTQKVAKSSTCHPRMSFSRWVVRQRRGDREMTRGARTREEITEKTNESGREEREARENWEIAKCSVRTLNCRWRKMRAIVTTAVDTSSLIFPPAIYRFCPRFFSSSICDAYCLTCMNIFSEVLFIIGPFFVRYVNVMSTDISIRASIIYLWLILMISNRRKIIKNQEYIKVKINWHSLIIDIHYSNFYIETSQTECEEYWVRLGKYIKFEI